MNFGIGRKAKFQYFGDIDYEGINIYETLKDRFKEYNISVHKLWYETILNLEHEPMKIRTQQIINNEKIESFLNEFSEHYQNKLRQIFSNRQYIPQEVFNLEVASKELKKGETYN